MRGDYDAAAGLCHDDFVFFAQIDTPRPGAVGFMEAEKRHVDAFDNAIMTVEVLVAEDDRVAAYVVSRAISVRSTTVCRRPAPISGCRCSTSSRCATARSSRSGAHYDRLDHIRQLEAGSA
jgi:hypothetical protein